MRQAPLLVVLATLSACVIERPVVVIPAGPALSLAPRAPDCAIEFYRVKPLERPFDEVATLRFEAAHPNTNAQEAQEAQEALRRQACAVGADAVVVTRELLSGTMIGVAVSYRDVREQHRAEAALRRESQAEFEKLVAEERQRLPGLPPGFIPARVRESTMLRADNGDAVDEVAAAAQVWVSQDVSAGWRRAFVPGGKEGWVRDRLLELRAPPTPSVSSGSRLPEGTNR